MEPSPSRTRPGPLTSALLPCLIAYLWAFGASAQATGQLPLFSDSRPLELRLEAPLRTLVNRSRRRPEVAGFVEYADATGETVRLDVEVRTRGNSRLEICRFPPLSLNFRRRQVPQTLFAGQNRIKLVTLCRYTDEYRQYLYLEQLAYSIYEQVTEFSYRTRFATVTYVNTERDNEESVAPAFFIEHADSAAERTLTRAVDLPGIAPRGDHAPDTLTLLTVFEFLIGNTDWSALRGANPDECCHNTDILIPRNASSPIVAVPYDFDQSGFVDAAYAEPDERFGIRSVRQRVYRGFCDLNEQLPAAIERFSGARENIDLLIRESRLNEEERDRALEYIDQGYQVLTDPQELQEQVLDRCRR